jgi:hypothetical protein
VKISERWGRVKLTDRWMGGTELPINKVAKIEILNKLFHENVNCM